MGRLFFACLRKCCEIVAKIRKMGNVTRILYWNHLGRKLYKNDAVSRCGHVDFVL
ncbi:hypothetical protein PIL02S_00992 [Paenibacillus illinoisensis]|jgi:hypothetical protein|uniref:Uncharacterized protein n=1 Tax=Paenibacillus illinoisensis TaxID=59845 RepID=A0A2W0CK40_9BACL|nr:hypothetical protein PIL02S_00992 [Paenibacillus illinoisensis]